MPSNINIINNFFDGDEATDAALVFGDVPGSNDDGPGGVYPNPVWIDGNEFPPETVDTYSTSDAPIAVPATARVTTWAVADLNTRMLPHVGTHFRTAEEQALIDEIAAALP